MTAGPLRRAAGAIARRVATDINRRLGDLLAEAPEVTVVRDRPVALGGFLRLIELRKE